MRNWVLAACLCAACTFPDVEYETSGAGAAAAGGASASASGSTASASTAQTGAGANDCGQGQWSSDCDADGDGWANEDCCSEPANRDCNDDNGDVHPGQLDYFADPVGSSFDYDCNNVEEEELDQGDCNTLSCASPPNPEYVFAPNGNYECGVPGVKRFCTANTCCAAGECDATYRLRCR
jgi:hypothetical protein